MKYAFPGPQLLQFLLVLLKQIWCITDAHARPVAERKTRQTPESSQLTVFMKPALRHEARRVLKQTFVASDAVQIRLTVRLQSVMFTCLTQHRFIGTCQWQYTPPTRLNCRIESCPHCAVCIEFATSSRQLPTDLVEKLQTEHVESSWVVTGRCVCTSRESWLSFQFFSQLVWINSQHVQFPIIRPNPQELYSCEFNTYRRRRRDSAQMSSWVASVSLFRLVETVVH